MAFNVSFDQLNQVYQDGHPDNMRSMPYEEYFGEMDLSDEQKEKREKTAREVETFMLLALMSMYYMGESGGYDYSEASSIISQNYKTLLNDLGVSLTSFFSMTHADATAAEIVSATLNHPDDPYFFSIDRAMLIAENEANSIWNDSEYQDAILTGKTRKTWNAIIDKATRDSHRDVNGVTVPIDEPFEVGDSLMMYPRDQSLGAGAEEVSNCRCSVTYS